MTHRVRITRIKVSAQYHKQDYDAGNSNRSQTIEDQAMLLSLMYRRIEYLLSSQLDLLPPRTTYYRKQQTHREASQMRKVVNTRDETQRDAQHKLDQQKDKFALRPIFDRPVRYEVDESACMSAKDCS